MDELTKAVRELKNGDQDAFQTVYDLTQKTTMAVIRKYCDSPADCTGILQDTYVHVLQSMDDLKDDGKVQEWINKIAAFTAVRFSMKKEPNLFSDIGSTDGEMPDFENESMDYDPAALSDENAAVQAVCEIMAMIPEAQRDMLWLFYGQRLKIREIAQGLGISENTVRSCLYQGRRNLFAHKDDLKKSGVDITAIPLAILLAMAFDDTVYAAAATAQARDDAVVSTVQSGQAASAGTGAVSGKTISGGTATAAKTTAEATGTKASGLSIGAKIAIAAAIVVVIAAVMIGVISAARSSARNESDTVSETVIMEDIDIVEETPEETVEPDMEAAFVQYIAESWPETYSDPEDTPQIPDGLTEVQSEVILEALPYLIYQFEDYSKGNTTLKTEDMSNEDVIRYLTTAMFWGVDTPMFEILEEKTVPSSDPHSYFTYRIWYDTDSTLKHLGDFFGKTITVQDVNTYDPDDYIWFMFDGDRFATLDSFGGDGVGRVVPRIESYTIEGGELTISLPYELQWDDAPEYDSSGHVTAVFKINPDSFFGYSLESLTQEYSEEKASVADARVETGMTEYGSAELDSRVVQITASSTLTDNGTVYPASLIMDGVMATAWSEGAEGYGIGESVTFSFNGTCHVSGLIIYNGYQKDSDLYYKNSRPREIMISTSKGDMSYIELADTMGPQTVTFNDPVDTTFIRITIESVYPGNKYEDTLISEIMFY